MGTFCGGRRVHATGRCTFFTDFRSAYYSIIRQYVVGIFGPDLMFRTLVARLALSEEVTAALLSFLYQPGSLLQQAGVSPALTVS